ncbi:MULTISPECIES: MGMT family protein [Halorubrum]|jgi:methylated-DNA-[protein]-cysteine S-methyltransferase|uniref:Cysteine methyltransferase n=1 Tax=Halorubrum ezzemoulense DSM 17463 TaxID=1121945 RepID=A0A1X4G9Q5_HALEZ|nr:MULTISPECIES: MGMT family protein [Halorubrum]MDB2237184.1 MGMT family protein [Halorubrum ezzemoulense]MDB2246866.1 MGMT family protein [Halorubrum ezzemoulense]OSO93853.1 cysteine methyltransferase [Halorubrum ezzemoulense DSM 17463]OYR84070.1 cysteine methyltransferase [Halorubrum ezzemoulense]PHQ42698.1 cysteine methyltransferase [Halorubrum sp. C191]
MSLSGTSGVFARQFDEIGRTVQIGFAGGRVISVSFPAEHPGDADGDHDLLDRIDAYLGGERDEFAEVALGLTVPTDRREALEALRSVPYGEEVSVSRLARLGGFDPDDPDDLEVVTGALADNPIPVLLPDHRVSGGPYATPSDVRSELRRVEGISR